MALTIPAEPKVVSYEVAPPGYRVSLVSFNDERRFIEARIQLAHTNGAKTEGSIESSKSWAERRTYNGEATTLPHFQVDRDGDAAMLLELNRQGIAAYRANSFAICYETADRGWAVDPYPAGSYYTEPQMQKLANGFAYVSLLRKIPLVYPTTWDGWGSASHTEPFSYPYWTKYIKTCPGDRKKVQLREIILPHARKIFEAWTATPTPVPPPATGTYTVVSGDGWYAIARKTQMSLNELLAINKMTINTPLHPGMVLKTATTVAIRPDTTLWVTPPATVRLNSTDASTRTTDWPAGTVSYLQTILGTTWPTTGVFNAKDVAKIVEYQKLGGLVVDGVYGQQTVNLFMQWRGR
jgi:LysM repeat protein